ncbi:lysozyme RrrD-like [Daphnia pulicaria]|uniref:lysozyme RrrD-like n=1 Tax=Daphnia pulicaria TaxID=35523 RepID=UPI001EEA0A7E|nr:lysozyme RrrD-like [Daphnia pulicaria]
MKIAVCCLIVLAALTAPALAARTVSQAGYDLIKGFEGLSLVAYQDIGGVWTIGYGNTLYQDGSPVRQGDTITQQGADDLFQYWVDESFAPEVDRLVGTGVVLRQQQFDALVSLTYNIGTGAFSTSTLLKKVRVWPDDPTIRDEFMRWVYVNGEVSQGLVNRREKEADFYFS